MKTASDMHERGFFRKISDKNDTGCKTSAGFGRMPGYEFPAAIC